MRDAATATEPCAALAERDPVLADLISRHGCPNPFAWPEGDTIGGTDPFAALLLHITGQQISIAAALAIYGRVLALLDSAPTPERLLDLSPAALRGAGLSRAKVAAFHDLAERVVDGRLAFDRLAAGGDEAVLAELTAVRGIGPWSAQMFMLHELRRPDVLPAADIGLRKAAQALFALEAVPRPNELAELGRTWAPYRSYAAALLWSA